MSQFQGKVVVVTGASKGIGAEIARQFGAAGASVVVNYATSREGADKVVADITKKGGKAVAIQANIAKQAEVVALFAQAAKQFGRIDVLVNNAGVYEFAPLVEITEEHIRKQFDLNVTGLLLASKEAAKYFAGKGGNIVNISSIVSTLTPPNSAAYTATKASVDAITRVLAKELGPQKIRVNSVNPGMVATEGWRTAGIEGSDMHKGVIAQTPLGRIGDPADIAPAVLFLASDGASWITGETLVIAGGLR